MRNLKSGILIFLIMAVLTGVVYPLVITVISQTAFPDKANGSLLSGDGEIHGSILAGQKFTLPEYFWPRPSISEYNALPSGASNQGPTSEALRQAVEDRSRELTPYISGQIPADLLLASGSGLDPHISPDAALVQIDHVAQARNLSAEQKAHLRELVNQYIEQPQWGVFGAPRVNVLRLNLAVDDTFGKPPLEGANQH
ncbi:MAG: potassium-transporting ATPase subunit KdpC [bacterium]|nr:potassium-transporting ATPase subunit KdpC [bacterium]